MTHDSARGSRVEWKESGLWNHPGLGLDPDSPPQWVTWASYLTSLSLCFHIRKGVRELMWATNLYGG